VCVWDLEAKKIQVGFQKRLVGPKRKGQRGRRGGTERQRERELVQRERKRKRARCLASGDKKGKDERGGGENGVNFV
jgi:hypothetical protein